MWVNIDSGNGLLPEGTKSLREQMLTNSLISCGIYPGAISQEMLNIFIFVIILNIAESKLQPHLPGVNRLMAITFYTTDVLFLAHL